MNLPSPPQLPDYAQAWEGGVVQIDTGYLRPGFDAAYLVVDDGRAAFIDTGTRHSVPRLLAVLDALELPRDAVDWVIPTHVHLDHAGGAGCLMQALPHARLAVHSRGVRHMIDPSALWAGALAVYGEAEMQRAYGYLEPVAAERVHALQEGSTLTLGQRELRVVDTPGHARHHVAIWDPVTRGWFTGDTFGLSYRELDVAGQAWLFPSSSPVQFEPEALEDSIQRLLAAQPDWVYPTHFGRLGQVEELGGLLLDLLEQTVTLSRAIAARVPSGPARAEALRRELSQLYLDSLRAHGCPLSEHEVQALLHLDLALNAEGLQIWLDRPTRA